MKKDYTIAVAGTGYVGLSIPKTAKNRLLCTRSVR